MRKALMVMMVCGSCALLGCGEAEAPKTAPAVDQKAATEAAKQMGADPKAMEAAAKAMSDPKAVEAAAKAMSDPEALKKMETEAAKAMGSAAMPPAAGSGSASGSGSK